MAIHSIVTDIFRLKNEPHGGARGQVKGLPNAAIAVHFIVVKIFTISLDQSGRLTRFAY